MRKLTKGGAPQVLIDNAAAWAADWVAANADDKKKLIQRYRHPQVRAAVRQETNKKCAYCEIKMEAGSFAHIEHIMPKSHFPERAFDWQNLTNGCPACNGNKGDTIPTPNNFVSPYSNPEARLSVIGSMLRCAAGDTAAKGMIAWLDLNREGLLLSRAAVFERVQEIFLIASKLPKEARREFVAASIAPMISDTSEFTTTAICAVKIMEHEYLGQI